jgi:NADPH:quinone reductase-like Zn-dependent oxidoreductase
MPGAGINTIGGRVQVLELDVPLPIASDEVLIAVKTAGVGNWDERAGSATGMSAGGLQWRLRQDGAWTHKLVAPAALVAQKPTNVSWESAAAFPVPALTAAQVLEEALEIRSGEWVLVHGGGGVTGGMLVQLGVAKGAV